MKLDAITYFTVFAGILCLVINCAQPIPPQGGPKDRKPPQLDTLASSPNFQTGYNKQPIILVFDEWIQLKDQFTQIVISPPPEQSPQIKARGKTIEILFAADEQLEERTTYTINFGSAITDLTESNVLDGFKYIFSTGDYIDSLSVRGSVMNASDNMPAKGVLVLLHLMGMDSAIYVHNPVYFTKTDSSGHFLLENLRSDTFMVFGLEDKNLNYKYDRHEELVGFYPLPLTLSDTTEPQIQFTVFNERQPLLIEKRRFPGPGTGIYGFNRLMIKPELVPLRLPQDSLIWLADHDTLRIWCRGLDTLEAEFSDEGVVIDTLNCSCFQYTVDKPGKVKMIAADRNILPDRPWTVKFSTPVVDVDTHFIELWESDTIRIDDLSFHIDTIDRRKVHFKTRWKENVSYTLKCFPGGINGYFRGTTDTLSLETMIVQADTRSTLHLQITDLDPMEQFVLEFVQDGKQLEKRTINQTDSLELTVTGLVTNPLTIRLIEDINKNGVWDPGDIDARKLPETVEEITVTSLRAGWEVNSSFKWKN